MIIFEKSQSGRFAFAQAPRVDEDCSEFPTALLRQDIPLLPEVSELEVVRHYTRLSQKNYCIDTQFYPLGSCTMKYNPRGMQALAMLDPFKNLHPLVPIEAAQGLLQCLFELQEMLKNITGMSAVSLTPMAGAQGEWAGIAMIRAYHHARGDVTRNEMLVPEGAHGTNPASAAMSGFVVKEVPTTNEGDIDLAILQTMVGPNTAGIMLTNPSTLGVFERKIVEVAKCVHQAGGLLYYDGANLNAILGKIRPSEMGFDVMHMNLHKTFATPHGGGGPGGGPIAVSERLAAYLPIPLLVKEGLQYRWQTDCPDSIGRLSAFMGNAGVLLRAYIYIRLLGEQGLMRVGEYATLNANYLMHQLSAIGYTVAFPTRRATHEFIITVNQQAKEQGITALDLAKRLLDAGFYAPTIYFPLLIPECLLIEPTETESKQTLDQFIDAMQIIWNEIHNDPDKIHSSPRWLPCNRLDEVKAARELDLVWKKV
jgi:glycine dehydrogenase subunit 2